MLVYWVKTIWAKGGGISPSWSPTIIFSEKKSGILNNLSLDRIHAQCLKLHKCATKIYIMGVVDSSVVYEGPSFTVNTTPLKGEVRKLPDVNGRRHMYQVFIFIPFSSLSGPILNTQLSLNVSPSAKSILLRLLLQSRLKIKCFALRDKKCICVDKFCPNYAKS